MIRTLSTRAALLAVVAAAFAAPLGAQAAAPSAADQARPQSSAPQGQDRRDNDRRDNDRRDDNRRDSDRYGRWESSWGARPPAPPRHFTKTSDWHRHVRACQQRYRTYNPATDRYVVRRGQTAICRL